MAGKLAWWMDEWMDAAQGRAEAASPLDELLARNTREARREGGRRHRRGVKHIAHQVEDADVLRDEGRREGRKNLLHRCRLHDGVHRQQGGGRRTPTAQPPRAVSAASPSPKGKEWGARRGWEEEMLPNGAAGCGAHARCNCCACVAPERLRYSSPSPPHWAATFGGTPHCRLAGQRAGPCPAGRTGRLRARTPRSCPAGGGRGGGG